MGSWRRLRPIDSDLLGSGRALEVPYYLSPGWLKIDPNFDSPHKNPRFRRLVAGGK